MMISRVEFLSMKTSVSWTMVLYPCEYGSRINGQEPESRSQEPGENPDPIKAVKADYTAENAELAERVIIHGEGTFPVKTTRADLPQSTQCGQLKAAPQSFTEKDALPYPVLPRVPCG
jgi:hypothetical protein